MSAPILFERAFPTGDFRVHDGDPVLALPYLKQVHGAVVLDARTVTHGQEADGLWAPATDPRALAIRTADCLPILLIGPGGSALLHAGWRGLAADIIGAPEVRALAPHTAFIGPCIHACCFAVTAEFAGHFPGRPLESRPDGTLRFDLVAEAQRQVSAHYGIAAVDSGDCTCCLPQYSSYRRDKTTRRIWNCFFPRAK
jgi:copper oxidase (laccase) domain-containing protein